MKILLSFLVLMILIGPLWGSEAESLFVKEILQLNQKGIRLAEILHQNSSDKKVKKWALDFKNKREKEETQLLKLKVLTKGEVSGTPTGQYQGPTDEKTIMENLIKNREDAIVLTSKGLPELKRNDLRHQALKMVKQEGHDIEKMQRFVSSNR